MQQTLPTMWQTGMDMFAAYGVSQADGDKAMEQYDTACDQVIRSAAEFTAIKKKGAQGQMETVTLLLSRLAKKVTTTGGVAAIMGFFVLASEEQTATTREISSNVLSLNGLAQHSNHALQETSSVAEDLSRQATELKLLVGQFKLGE